MVAFADILAEHVAHKNLGDLHSLQRHKLMEAAEINLGEIPRNRRGCAAACISALRHAFADYRSRQVEEFRGEKALVCTCFGVTEETIENVVQEPGIATVDGVTKRCKAGSGCGSCTMIIQEILDNRAALRLS
jgi:NifU-like protein